MRQNASAPTGRLRQGVTTLKWLAAIVSAYFLTAGLVPSLNRHTGDGGRLTWLPAIPGAMALLRVYQKPAAALVHVPVLGAPLEWSAEFWWELTNPPDTTP